MNWPLKSLRLQSSRTIVSRTIVEFLAKMGNLKNRTIVEILHQKWDFVRLFLMKLFIFSQKQSQFRLGLLFFWNSCGLLGVISKNQRKEINLSLRSAIFGYSSKILRSIAKFRDKNNKKIKRLDTKPCFALFSFASPTHFYVFQEKMAERSEA